jgi:large subunit ribosomal protein L22
MKASLRNVRISPKKVNLVAELVRTQDLNQALGILEFTPKKAAKILYKVIASAKANAETNDKVTADNLYIKEIKVSKGMTIKRFIPISRGRANPINKFCSHIHVILADKSEQEAKQELTTKKSAAKTTVAKKPKTTVTKAKAVASKASNK